MGVCCTNKMVTEGNFKRINVMVMGKHALSPVRNCAGTSFSNCEGLFSLLFIAEKLAFVS